MQAEYTPIFKEARDTIEQKGFSASLDYTERLTTEYPDCETFQALHANTLLWSGKVDEAERFVNQRLAARSSASIYAIKGALENYNGNVVKAVEYLNMAADLDPNDYYYLLITASIASQSCDLDTAIDTTKRMLELFPEDAASFSSLITAYQCADRYDEGLGVLENAPDWFKARSDYPAKRGVFYLQNNQVEEAESSFQDAVDKCPGSATYWANLGLAQFHLGKHIEAESSCLRALELNPRVLVALTHMALLSSLKNDKRAQAEYERRAKTAVPRLQDTHLFSQASRLTASGLFDEAIKTYQKIEQESNPAYARIAKKSILLLLIGRGRWDEARQRLDELRTEQGLVPMTRIAQVQVDYHDGKVEDALRDLDALVAQPETNASVYLVAIGLYAHAARGSDVLKIYERLKTNLPGMPSTLGGCVKALTQANYMTEANELLKRVRHRFPNDTSLKRLEVHLALERGDNELAMRMLKEVGPLGDQGPVGRTLLKMLMRTPFWKALAKVLLKKKE